VSIEALVAAAMVGLVKPDTEEGNQRLRAMAATFTAEATPVAFWSGDEGLLATTLMLVAIGFHESKFQEKTRCCLPRRGTYLGLFQLLPGPNTRPFTTAEVCASDAVQARLALRVLKGSRDRCKGCTPSHTIRAFASGDGGVQSKEAREIIDLWSQAAVRSGLRVYPYSRQAPCWLSAR
jgi:hypothetical protein